MMSSLVITIIAAMVSGQLAGFGWYVAAMVHGQLAGFGWYVASGTIEVVRFL